MKARRLKARDVERLENTSFAMALPGADAPPALEPGTIFQLLDDTEQCSDSCGGDCTCHCQSNLCCLTDVCAETGSAQCPTWACPTAPVPDPEDPILP